MQFGFRETFPIIRDLLRANIGKRSASLTARVGPLSETVSTSGRRVTTLRFGRGLSWRHYSRGQR